MLYINGNMVSNKTETFKVGGNYQFIVQHSNVDADKKFVEVKKSNLGKAAFRPA